MSILGLWPKEQPRPTQSTAEYAVYKALVLQLPKGWSAWHSLRVRTDNGIEGEGDFVFAIPDRGFLVLEVKGGNLDMRDGRWFQNGHPLDKAPREQAHSYAKTLLNRLKERGIGSVPYAILTIFPDTAFSKPPSQDDLANLLLGEQDLPWLVEAIEARLDQTFPADYVLPKSNWPALLHEFWGETWLPRLKLGQRARINAEERYRLDRIQLELIDALIGNRRLLVEGVAGSGKTVLAAEAARRMAASGKKVLYLCFTDALAQWLASSLEEYGVQVATVPRYALACLQQAGLVDDVPASQDAWFDISLRAAVEALPESHARPDVVIIDEAQDLLPNDWLLIEELARNAVAWTFQDPAQAFWPDRQIPEWAGSGGRFTLSRCYRCPDAITEFSLSLRGEEHDAVCLQEGYDQGIVAQVKAPSTSALESRIENEIRKLRSQGFAPEQIAVISLRGQSASDGFACRQKIGSFPVVRADDPQMGSQIVADTFLRFKGLERPAVIVTDQRLVDKRLGVRQHIALTRATDVVRLVEMIV